MTDPTDTGGGSVSLHIGKGRVTPLTAAPCWSIWRFELCDKSTVHLWPNKTRPPNFSRCQSSESSLSWIRIPNYIHQSIQFLYFLPFPLFWLPLPPFGRFPLPPLSRCSFLFIPRMSFFRRLSTTLKAPLTPGGRLIFLPTPFLVTTYVTSLFSFPTPAFL